MSTQLFHHCSTCLLAAGLVMAAASVFGQDASPDGRYIVQVKPGVDPAEVAESHGLQVRHVYKHALKGFAGPASAARLESLARDPRVTHISVDRQVFAFVKPIKPTPSGETTPAGVTRIGASSIWGTYNGAGIGVAIVDTGLDFNHQDLPVSTAWSFVSPGFTYTSSAQDDDGHGTHVGGIVAAIDNDKDVVGVAPGATLYAVKVLDQTGSGYDSDVISGLNAVVANAEAVTPAIRVVNMSLGRDASDDDSAMRQAIINLVNAGVSVVVAAGNDASAEVSQMVPAGFPEVIAVASTTAKAGTSNTKRVAAIPADTASYFTTDGKYDPATGIGVAISAPGEEQENIQYPRINSVGILSTKLGGGTTRMSGTSMASPHAAGAVALLLQKCDALGMVLDPADVKARIMTGDKEGIAPLNSPTTIYTYDGEREGILYIPALLGN